MGYEIIKDDDTSLSLDIKTASEAKTSSNPVIMMQSIDENGKINGVKLTEALNKDIDSVTSYQAGCNCTTVDLATDADVVVTASPALLLGVKVLVTMSAHAAIIKDSATAKITLPASTVAGYEINAHGTIFATNITVESDNSGTGTLLIFWRAL